jgi:2-dehydro-3-deoxygalactonokinase
MMAGTTSKDSLILGDWGTSRLRLFRLVAGKIVDHRHGPGVAHLNTSAAQTLRAALCDWREEPTAKAILLCGMAGSGMGLFDVPHARCPIDLRAWQGKAFQTRFDDIPITIATGLCCTSDDFVPDIMRGEETQIFGAMAIHPELAIGDHVFILPGTHSKCAQVADGFIMGFSTYMTGEMFNLFVTHSTLASGGVHPLGEVGEADDGFAAGVARARSGDPLTRVLFEARSMQLRAGKSQSWAHGFMSGLLIGHELMAAGQHSPVLIGAPALTQRYQRALELLGLSQGGVLDGDACALAGLHVLKGD